MASPVERPRRRHRVRSKIFAGNTADVTTVEDMVELMETKYGKARRMREIFGIYSDWPV